jgi:hypothetical protein
MAYTSYFYNKVMQALQFTLSETQIRKQTEKYRYKETSIHIVMEEIYWTLHRR